MTDQEEYKNRQYKNWDMRRIQFRKLNVNRVQHFNRRRNKHNHNHNHHEEFLKYHSYFKYLRPIILLSNVLIWYLIFRYIGLKTVSIVFALFIVLKGSIEIVFLWRIEKRIFKPIEKLKNGVEEIAKGNYEVRVELHDMNAVTILADAFNDMAEKLEEGERVKKEYEENRKTLIANISHDLKTPITSIQGYIELLLDETILHPENKTKYLQTIYNNSSYINKLIDDLFLFSKLDMEKLDFEFERILIKPFMEDLMEEFKFELEDKKATFKYIDLTDREVYVNLDRKRFYQIIKNLIGNAVKFASDKALLMEVQMTHTDNKIIVEISDNGIGIAKDKLPFIFDRFYRIDSERSKDFSGTGLGLAIAKELMNAHGGSIEATSVETEGTRFTLTIPISE